MKFLRFVILVMCFGIWVHCSPGVQASYNKTREITFPTESCERSPIQQNVTLQGGIEAGVFKKLAQFVAMQLCIRMCCEDKGCDVALMSGKNCYGVQCFSENSCLAIPAVKAPTSLMISHVTIKGEGDNNNQTLPTPHNLKCTVTDPEDGVTLNGGLKSGNFTDVGKVEDINSCTRLCCVSEKCDLALFIKKNCFLVSCFTADLCKTIKTETRNYRPTVAYVQRSWTTSLAKDSAMTLNSLPATNSKLSCKNSDVKQNFTLRGGYRAGNFTDLGKVSNMSACIRYCCGRKNCDVAMMLEYSCYAVHCFNDDSCKSVKARRSGLLSHLSPKLSYITSRSEEVLPQRIPLENGSSCQPSVISYDVTLKGGIKAGTFTPIGYVDTMQTCVSLCCQRPTCDVAFMLKTTCYSIKCSSEEMCEQVQARASKYSPRLSYVRRFTNNDAAKGRKKKLKKSSSNSTASLDDHYCTQSEVINNVTLKGGITAGRFRDRGRLPGIEECAEVCCIAKECDLAFMLKDRCFTVTCSSSTSCEAVKAKSSNYSPTIVYVYARTLTDSLSGTKRRRERFRGRRTIDLSRELHVKESNLRRRLERDNSSLKNNSRKRKRRKTI